MDKETNAIDLVRQMIADGQISQEVAEKYFPELKESEDERIRKYLIKCVNENMFVKPFNADGFDKFTILAWLEKQGEQKYVDKIQLGKKYKCIASPRYSTFVKGFIYIPEDKFLCSLMNFSSDCFEPIEDGEHKPADKVEPKFKVGDWIISHYNNVAYIESISETKYNLRCKDGYHEKLDIDCINRNWRLWTIQDAKEGDVLETEGFVFIFKEIREDKGIGYFCANEKELHEGDDDTFYIANPNSLMGSINNGFTHYTPATKEQRDTLEKAMTDAGYTFDFEKKKLKQIEQNPAWSEEDEEIYKKCILAMRASACGFPEEEKFVEQVDNWLKSIKDRVLPQPKQEWSEEDEKALKVVTDIFGKYGVYLLNYPSFIHWLKTLPNRITLNPYWKPSEEQMKALSNAGNSFRPFEEGHKVLWSLYNDLKKLREEKL